MKTAPRQIDVIREAAARLFGEHGFNATSMRDIGTAVGMLPGSLYSHITGKEALLYDLVAEGLDRFVDAGRPIAEDDGPAARRLEQLMCAHVRLVSEDPLLMRVISHEWRFLQGAFYDEAVAKRATYQSFYNRVVEDGVRQGTFTTSHPGLAVLGILGALNWLPEWVSSEGAESPQEIGDDLTRLMLDGLGV